MMVAAFSRRTLILVRKQSIQWKESGLMEFLMDSALSKVNMTEELLLSSMENKLDPNGKKIHFMDSESHMSITLVNIGTMDCIENIKVRSLHLMLIPLLTRYLHLDGFTV